MPFLSFRMHRIYLAATMNYGLGSDDSEELAYYNKIRKEMNDIKKTKLKKGLLLIVRSKKKQKNESKYFLIDRWKSVAYWTANADNF